MLHYLTIIPLCYKTKNMNQQNNFVISYLNGDHHVGWHSDAEDDLVDGSSICTLSLGSDREFQLRHHAESLTGKRQTELNLKLKTGELNKDELTDEDKRCISYKVGNNPDWNKSIVLSQGDMLVMKGNLQKNWRHRITKTNAIVGPRIAITFRLVKTNALK